MKREAKGKSPLPSCASRPSAIRGNIPISLRRARLAQHPRGKLPLPIPCSPRSSQRDTYTERGVLRQEFEIDISNPTHRHRARKEKNPTPSPPHEQRFVNGNQLDLLIPVIEWAFFYLKKHLKRTNII